MNLGNRGKVQCEHHDVRTVLNPLRPKSFEPVLTSQVLTSLSLLVLICRDKLQEPAASFRLHLCLDSAIRLGRNLPKRTHKAIRAEMPIACGAGVGLCMSLLLGVFLSYLGTLAAAP